jgi:hypothetical protein
MSVSSSVTLRWADLRSLRLVSSANQRSTRLSQLRIPIESDHLFRSNPIADSGVSDHLAGAGVS